MILCSTPESKKRVKTSSCRNIGPLVRTKMPLAYQVSGITCNKKKRCQKSCIKSFLPYKDRNNRSAQQSSIIYRENIWDCNGFYIGNWIKLRLHGRKTELFGVLAKNDNTSVIADHVKTTGHSIKWDHFNILAKGKQTTIAKSKRPYLCKNMSQLSMSTSEEKS